MRIREMRNLGPASERMLKKIDVTCPEELAALGAAEAFRRLSFIQGRPANLNLLYAMDGALSDTDWRAIPASRKEELRAQAICESPRRPLRGRKR